VQFVEDVFKRAQDKADLDGKLLYRQAGKLLLVWNLLAQFDCSKESLCMNLFLRRSVRWLGCLAGLVVLAYVGVCAFVSWQKESMIFPYRQVEASRGRAAPAGWETWWHEAAPGIRVEAWFRPAQGLLAGERAPAVIFFHGNGEVIDDCTRDFAGMWGRLGCAVLLVEYRGYGRSGGEPTLAGARADAGAWFDRLATDPRVRADLIIAHGFSLGGGVAAALAAERPVAGALVESTFYSLPRAARDRGLWLYFATDRHNTGNYLRALPVDLPLQLTHGTLDEVLPVHHGRALAAVRPTAPYTEARIPHVSLSAQAGRADLAAALLATARARAERIAAKTKPAALGNGTGFALGSNEAETDKVLSNNP
jgi:uncharacterized protein